MIHTRVANTAVRVLVSVTALAMLGPVGWLSPQRRASEPAAAIGSPPAPMQRSVQRSAPALQPVVPAPRADFAATAPSAAARQLADWVLASGDNRDMAFLVVDKPEAQLFVFDPRGTMQGHAPILLGLARGDDSTPGIGEKQLSEIRPEERITPAGRFVAQRGRNLDGEDIVWVDYDAGVSMHRVRAKVAAERRLQRLASPTTKDNRISYGCINVPAQFYENVVNEALARGKAVVYVVPEVRTLVDVFHMHSTERLSATGVADHP